MTGLDRRPILCLVTDRRRALPRGDEAAARACLLSVAKAAADAEIDLIHVRERDLDGGALAALVSAVVEAVRGSATRVLVNDRLDVAVACGAAGVHLRSDSMPVASARALAPGLLVGRSVHSSDEAVSGPAVGADYLIAGTVFATASKPRLSGHLGRSGLSAIVRATRAPVLAIGGVTAERVAEVLAAGAAGIAAIGYFLDDSAASCGAASIASRAAALRRAFDSARAAP